MYQRIIISFLHMIAESEEIKKEIFDFQSYGNLHRAEVLLLKTIQETRNTHVSALSRELDITKGAVSQTLTRLQQKGMIIKKSAPEGGRKLEIDLTPKGNDIYRMYAERRDRINALFLSALKGADSEQLVFLETFMKKINKELRNF